MIESLWELTFKLRLIARLMCVTLNGSMGTATSGCFLQHFVHFSGDASHPGKLHPPTSATHKLHYRVGNQKSRNGELKSFTSWLLLRIPMPRATLCKSRATPTQKLHCPAAQLQSVSHRDVKPVEQKWPAAPRCWLSCIKLSLNVTASGGYGSNWNALGSVPYK